MILGFTPPGGIRLGADDYDGDGYDDVTGEWIDYSSGYEYTDPATGTSTGDLDGDGYDDGSGEWLGMPGDTGYDPWLDASPDQDSDGDGITDFDEVFGFSIETVITTDGTQLAEYFDPDTGEITYVEEPTTTTQIVSEWITTDPTRPDSDHDGLPDGWERDMGFHPGQPDDGWADADGDGLANGVEYPLGTGIWNPDSDGDDLNDGEEVILFGSDPLDPADPGDPGETEGEEETTEADDGTGAMSGGDDDAVPATGDPGDGGADDSMGAGEGASNDSTESNPEPPTEPKASSQTPSAGAPTLVARAVIYSGGAPREQPDGSGHVLPGDDPTSGGGDGGQPATAYVTTKTWIPQTITIETVAEVESRHGNVPPSPYDYALPELGASMSPGNRAGLVGEKISATAGAHLHAMGAVYPQGQRAEVWLRIAEEPPAPVSRTYVIEATRTTTLDPDSPSDGTPMHLTSPQTFREYGTVTFTIDPANHGTESSITTLRAPGGFAGGWVSTDSGGSLKLVPPLESPYLEGDTYVGGANHSISLLPVELKVTKEGEADAPEDGLIVKKTDMVRYSLSPDLPDNPVLLEDEIQWYWRILKWDGTFSDWMAYDDGEGHTFTAQPEDAGIYEVKATVEGQDFLLKRKKDDPHSAKKKNENDCFGVVDEQWQIDVRDEAKGDLGAKSYAFAVANPPLPKRSFKCNLFVAHKATGGGAAVPWINGGRFFIGTKYPPVANQWAGTEAKHIPNWTLLARETYPQAGWVIARGVPGGTGHTGIIDYDGAWISAGTTEVNRKADLRKAKYQPARFRKYTP